MISSPLLMRLLFARENRERMRVILLGRLRKGSAFLICRERYDVVVANPPYLSSHNLNENLRNLLRFDYPEVHIDLYSSFIFRCLDLTELQGRCGWLSIHSFMFISSYEELKRNY